MKITKTFTLNAGHEYEKSIYNGNWLYARTHDAIGYVLEGFLNEGWTLVTIQPVYDPSVFEMRSWSFYRGGMMLVFEKDVAMNENDGAEDLMYRLLENLRSKETDEANITDLDDEPDDYEEIDDDMEYDDDDDYEEFEDMEYDDDDDEVYDDMEYDDDEDDEDDDYEVFDILI